MATDLYELAIRYKSEGFAAVSKDLDTLDKKGKAISTAFAALKGTLIVGVVGGFLKKVADESIEAQKQTAQLNAVLKSTGGIAGVTAPEIEELAGALQKTTTFSDDTVKSAASLLLTFTNIRGEIFKQTLPAILDMSQAMGTDLKEATIQVGKALNDPVAGMTALRKVGVAFSESQQAVIKNLVETNQLAKAQGLILKELQTEFGGSAVAARDTLGGALEGLKNSWGDLFEVTTDGTKGVVGAINRLSDALDRNKEKWHRWAGDLLDESGGPLHFLNVIIAKMNQVGDWLHRNPFAGGGAGGGSGGGRDTPTGPLTLPGAVVMAQKPAPLTSGGGKAGGGGRGTAAIVDQEADAAAMLREISDRSYQDMLRAAHRDDEADFARIDSEYRRRNDEISKLKVSEATKTQLLLASAEERGSEQLKLDAEIWERIRKQREDQRKQDEAEAARRPVGQVPTAKQFEGEAADAFNQYIESIIQKVNNMGVLIQQSISQTLGDAIYNGFAAAFDGEGIGGTLKAFGKTILAGIGKMLTDLGMVYLEYGTLMQSLAAFLPNPFTAGWAGLAIGAALIAMGAALGAVGKGSARGTATAGGFRENPGGATADITRYKFIDRNGSLTDSLIPRPSMVFNVFGPDDPKAQRAIMEAVEKGSRRAA